MEFEDFALEFRKRAAQRLTHFEKVLEKAQADLEKSAEKAAKQAENKAGVKPEAQPGYENRKLDYRTPDIPSARKRTPAPEQPQSKQGPKTPGQVKSVLRKG